MSMERPYVPPVLREYDNARTEEIRRLREDLNEALAAAEQAIVYIDNGLYAEARKVLLEVGGA